jgi:CRISPR-associated exonuclease Cas4
VFAEDDLLPISGLQHLRFCARQWGLIHLEQQWEENRLTAEGRLLHERTHEAGTEARPGVVTARGLHLRSLRFGLTGQADVVEFEEAPEGGSRTVELPGRAGRWRPFPVEYKRGRRKADSCDEVQLCAQALCLEEMLGVEIGEGALYYGAARRRVDVSFGEGLRAETEELARRMHALYSAGRTPPPEYGKKCESCSLAERCLPRAAARRVARYLAGALRSEETEP